MAAKIARFQLITLLAIAWVSNFSGCSTTELTPTQAPAPAVPPAPPPYSFVPHPLSTDMGDLRALLLDRTAPTAESMKDCSSAIKTLRGAAKSEQEFQKGMGELVHGDPVHYHWCFYMKLAELDQELRKAEYIDEKQKHVLEYYSYLVPIARTFMNGFRDSRYLRWAVSHYRRLSEWVFFRRLDLSPQTTQELVQAAQEFGNWREPAAADSVLEKYKILPDSKAKTQADSTPKAQPESSPKQPDAEDQFPAMDPLEGLSESPNQSSQSVPPTAPPPTTAVPAPDSGI